MHVDGALGRGIVANRGYLDAVEPLLFPVEKLGFGQPAAQSGDDMAVDGPPAEAARSPAETQAAAETALGAADAEQAAPPAIETGD